MRIALLLFTFLFFPATGVAAGVTDISFSTATAVPSDDGLELTGYLHVPEGDGPFPAVILMHGCSGLRSNGYRAAPVASQYQGWTAEWLSRGYVVMLVDSFWPRYEAHPELYVEDAGGNPADFIDSSLKECSNGTLGINEVTQRAYDAHAAKEYLLTASGVDIDPERIFLQGWSHGASSAMAAMHEEHAGGTAEFRAAVVSYPGCSVYGAMPDVRPVGPLLMLHAELDPLYSNSTYCEDQVRSAHDAGFDGFFEMAVYAGADHSFEIAGGAANDAAAIHARATTTAFFEHLQTHALPQSLQWSRSSPFLSARPYLPAMPPIVAEGWPDDTAIDIPTESINLAALFTSPLGGNIATTIATSSDHVTIDGDDLVIDVSDAELPLVFAVTVADDSGQRVQWFEVRAHDVQTATLVISDHLVIEQRNPLQFPAEGPLNVGDVPFDVLLDGLEGSEISAAGLPDGLAFESGSLTGDLSGIMLPFNFVAEVALSSATVQLNVTVAAHPLTPGVATLSIAGIGNIAPFDDIPDDDVPDDEDPAEKADLSLSMIAEPEVTRGKETGVLVTVVNSGPDAAQGAAVELSAPDTWTITRIDHCETLDKLSASRWVCDIGAMAAGATARLDAVLAAPASSTAASGTLTAVASATTSDPNAGNNSDSASITLTDPSGPGDPDPQPQPGGDSNGNGGGGGTGALSLLLLTLLHGRRPRHS